MLLIRNTYAHSSAEGIYGIVGYGRIYVDISKEFKIIGKVQSGERYFQEDLLALYQQI